MAIDFPSSPTVGQQYTFGGITYVFTATGVWATAGASAVAVIGAAPQGRLTLQSATPVMTTTQSAKTTIFYTPYVGNQLPINGTTMTMTTFAELSVATTDTTKSPAAIGASKVNDWFVWNDGGTIRVGHGPDWTSDTVRSAGTALVMVNGILLNNAAITNGPAASRGTYVGTTRSNASSQIDFQFGAIAATGTPGIIGVWNAYNRISISMFVGDNTDSWTYVTAAWRAANASNNMRVSFVSGFAEDGFAARYTGIFSMSAANASMGIGLDSVTAFTGAAAWGQPVGGAAFTGTAEATGMMIGYHFVNALEYANGGTMTGYGDLGTAFVQSGLTFTWRC